MNAVAVSSTTTYNSLPITSCTATIISAQCVWTGTPTGTLFLQVSNDGTTWSTTAEVFGANPAGGASNTSETWFGNGYKQARISYTNASGSGNLTVKVFLK